MSAAVLGYGTVFSTGDGNSPESFVAFAEVSAMDGPKFDVDTIDTSHEEPPGGAHDSFPGFLDAGEVSISFNLTTGSASMAVLMGEVPTRPLRNRKIVFPDGKVMSFVAFLKSFSSSETAADRVVGNATFKVSGDVVLT